VNNSPDIVCNCGTLLLKSYPNGRIKLRSRIVVFDGSDALALCRNCGQEHGVPLQLHGDTQKSMTHFVLEEN